MLTLDVLIQVFAQTVGSLKGAWGLVFMFLVAENYNFYRVNRLVVYWAIAVSTVWLLGKLNRHRVSRGAFKLSKHHKIIITGCSSGLGLYLAAVLSQSYQVVGIDLKPLPISLEVEFIQKDVLELDEIECDVLVNCAGIAAKGSLGNPQKTLFNYTSAVHTTTRALKSMQSGGCIVNISSATALASPGNCGFYAASKAALRIWHESLRRELRHTSVKTILVTPGQLDTPMFSSVKTPSSFLAPVVPATQLGDVIVQWLERGYSGEIMCPFYVHLLPFTCLLPTCIVDLLKDWIGLDKSMDSF